MRELEVRLAEVANSHGPALGEHAGATIAAGGKRLRPLLVFVAAGSDLAGRGAALRAAVAVELVHSATLVHDDVLDAAVLRRGRPTVVASAGRSIAAATRVPLFSAGLAETAGGARGARAGGRSSPCGSCRTRRRPWYRASGFSARTPGTSTPRASATCGAATS